MSSIRSADDGVTAGPVSELRASVVGSATARDGAHLQTRSWPVDGPTRASILIVHGLAEHSGRYERTGAIFAASGFAVAAFDLEGYGGSAGRRAWIPGWDTWLDDVEDRLADLRATANGRPVVLLGHSMGGLVCLTYAESDRPPPDLLVLSSPWLADTVPGWRRAVGRYGGLLLPTLSVDNGFDGSTLSRDPAVGIAYRVDPLAHHATTLGLAREVMLAQERAAAGLDRLKVPTFVTHGGADPLVPTGSSEIIARRPGIERKVYPGLRHETLNEPEGPEVVADMAAWIDRQLASSSPRAWATPRSIASRAESAR